jgi:tetratricopeptide (TPR) repeat protein
MLLGEKPRPSIFYGRALSAGVGGDSRAGAYLGLGSSLRSVGEYERALEVLEQGVEEFPTSPALKVFLAMALYYREIPEITGW